MNMKTIIKLFTIGALISLLACDDVETITPVPATSPSTFSAKFLLVNATPDAPALDLYINNLKVGSSVAVGEGQAAYNVVPITSNAVIANTNIRTKATSGTIGGILNSSDLIYRAGNTNTNNFTASNGASYTLFAVDSIYRPKPIRTLNALNAGDITYYSSKPSFTAAKKVGVGDTTIYLNVANFGVDTNSDPKLASGNSVIAYNLVKKYNGGVAPTFMVPIGVVPLGSSDVGGIRYYLWQDFFPTFATSSDSTNKAGFRIVNASPNAPALKVRLKYVSGAGPTTDISLNGGNAALYIMSTANLSGVNGINPTVGSRTVTATGGTNPINFGAQTVATTGNASTYDIEVSADNFATNLVSLAGQTFGGGTNKASNYTIIVSGLVGGTGDKALKITVVEHN